MLRPRNSIQTGVAHLAVLVREEVQKREVIDLVGPFKTLKGKRVHGCRTGSGISVHVAPGGSGVHDDRQLRKPFRNVAVEGRHTHVDVKPNEYLQRYFFSCAPSLAVDVETVSMRAMS